jgi:hypothetical protein
VLVRACSAPGYLYPCQTLQSQRASESLRCILAKTNIFARNRV